MLSTKRSPNRNGNRKKKKNDSNNQSSGNGSVGVSLSIKPALPIGDIKNASLLTRLRARTPHRVLQPVNVPTKFDGNTDRISLDRRGIMSIPVFESANLRLLSLQHNLISKLDGLAGKQYKFIVFIDLYDNQVDKISCLESLITLRVLLLGKNRIRKIEGLTLLNKLEVLDLHGNLISHLCGLETLDQLKLLNLAANQIKTIAHNDLRGLKSLKELNLRRNRICKLMGFGHTPSLEKLFINHNDISKIDDISSIAKATNLLEISIEHNPISMGGDCVSFLVSYLPNLERLSSMPINAHVRKAALIWRRNKEHNSSVELSAHARREQIISNARTNWELLRSSHATATHLPPPSTPMQPVCDLIVSSQSSDLISSLSSSSASTTTGTTFENYCLPPMLLPHLQDNLSSLAKKSDTVYIQALSERKGLTNVDRFDSIDSGVPESSDSSVQLAELIMDNEKEVISEQVVKIEVERKIKSACSSLARDVTAQSKKKRASTARANNAIISKTLLDLKEREQGGDYLIEISGKALNVFGQGALRYIDKPWNADKASDVTTVKFTYINFNNVIPLLHKVKTRFSHAESFEFYETNIGNLSQLNALAEIQGLSNLVIDGVGNAIVEKDWRLYAVYRLSHWGLQQINNIPVDEEEVTRANADFENMTRLVMCCLPDELLQPLLQKLHTRNAIDSGISVTNSKRWIMSIDHTLTNVIVKEALQCRKSTLTADEIYWRQQGKDYLKALLANCCESIFKLKQLQEHWPEHFQTSVNAAIKQFSLLHIRKQV